MATLEPLSICPSEREKALAYLPDAQHVFEPACLVVLAAALFYAVRHQPFFVPHRRGARTPSGPPGADVLGGNTVRKLLSLPLRASTGCTQTRSSPSSSSSLASRLDALIPPATGPRPLGVHVLAIATLLLSCLVAGVASWVEFRGGNLLWLTIPCDLQLLSLLVPASFLALQPVLSPARGPDARLGPPDASPMARLVSAWRWTSAVVIDVLLHWAFGSFASLFVLAENGSREDPVRALQYLGLLALPGNASDSTLLASSSFPSSSSSSYSSSSSSSSLSSSMALSDSFEGMVEWTLHLWLLVAPALWIAGGLVRIAGPDSPFHSFLFVVHSFGFLLPLGLLSGLNLNFLFVPPRSYFFESFGVFFRVPGWSSLPAMTALSHGFFRAIAALVAPATATEPSPPSSPAPTSSASRFSRFACVARVRHALDARFWLGALFMTFIVHPWGLQLLLAYLPPCREVLRQQGAAPS